MKVHRDGGDSNWIQAALETYENPLTRYALRITGDLERARDVVQDTFLQLCRQPSSRVRDYLPEWLYTVCRNKALDVRQKEKRMSPLEAEGMEILASTEPDPATRVENRDLTRQILRLVDNLSEDQREVVRLKFQADFSYKEISRVTGLSVSNVGFLLHVALKKVREQLEAQAAPAEHSLRRIK